MAKLVCANCGKNVNLGCASQDKDVSASTQFHEFLLDQGLCEQREFLGSPKMYLCNSCYNR